jgi:hypothetical protein
MKARPGHIDALERPARARKSSDILATFGAAVEDCRFGAHFARS